VLNAACLSSFGTMLRPSSLDIDHCLPWPLGRPVPESTSPMIQLQAPREIRLSWASPKGSVRSRANRCFSEAILRVGWCGRG
jgi:hypothetical protein